MSDRKPLSALEPTPIKEAAEPEHIATDVHSETANAEHVPAVPADVQGVEAAHDDWVLVPREPTEAMLDAYWRQTGESEAMRKRSHAYAARYFAAMLAASPTPPTEQGGM